MTCWVCDHQESKCLLSWCWATITKWLPPHSLLWLIKLQHLTDILASRKEKEPNKGKVELQRKENIYIGGLLSTSATTYISSTYEILKYTTKLKKLFIFIFSMVKLLSILSFVPIVLPKSLDIRGDIYNTRCF